MVRIEGYTSEELFALPIEELDAVMLAGRPIVVRVGSASLLAECRGDGESLVVDLAHIDGGGEGALPTIVAFVERYARSRQYARIEWAVRATNCARPNERLRRLLERRGFVIRDAPGLGECYYKATVVRSSDAI